MSGVGPARIHTAQPFTNQVAIPTGSNYISIDQREALGIDGSSGRALSMHLSAKLTAMMIFIRRRCHEANHDVELVDRWKNRMQ